VVQRIPVRAAPLQAAPPPETEPAPPQPFLAARRAAGAAGLAMANGAKRAMSLVGQSLRRTWKESSAIVVSCGRAAGRGVRPAGAAIVAGRDTIGRGVVALCSFAADRARRTCSFAARAAGTAWTNSAGVVKSCGEASARAARRAGVAFARSWRAAARGSTAATLAGARIATRRGSSVVRFAKVAGSASARGLKRGARFCRGIALGAWVILVGQGGMAARAVGAATARALAALLATSRKAVVFGGRVAIGIAGRISARRGEEAIAGSPSPALANARRPVGPDAVARPVGSE
jgi:hypothetical protein